MKPERVLKFLQKVVFSTLVFLMPSQLGLHLWPAWAHIYGIRVDYLSPTFYLTDVLVVILLFLWAIHLFVTKKTGVSLRTCIIVFCLMVFAALNVFVAKNYFAVIYKWIKVSEFALLAIYVVENKTLELYDWTAKALKYSLIAFSSIAILQFLFQRTIGGALYYLGERSFYASTPAIALTNFFGKRLLRAYSTFSHPNALAGYFLVGLFLVLGSRSRGRFEKRLTIATILFAITALVLSFSLGAWLTTALLALYFVFIKDKRVLKRAALTFFWMIAVASIISPLMSIFLKNRYQRLPESISKRLILSEVSASMFSENPILGIGLNNFVVRLPENNLSPGISWQLQPVHNVFLLAFSETGFLGFFLLFLLFWFALENTARAVNERKGIFLTLSLLAIVATGAVDHYWLTLQQNQLLAALLLGLSLRQN